jgi:hypothetical protein
LRQLTADENKAIGEQVRLKEISLSSMPARAGGWIKVNCIYVNQGKELVFSAEDAKPTYMLVFSLGLQSLDPDPATDPKQPVRNNPGPIITNRTAGSATRLAAGDSDDNIKFLDATKFPAGKYNLWVYLGLPDGQILDTKSIEVELEPPLR